MNRLTSSPLGAYIYGNNTHPDAATAIGSTWTAGSPPASPLQAGDDCPSNRQRPRRRPNRLQRRAPRRCGRVLLQRHDLRMQIRDLLLRILKRAGVDQRGLRDQRETLAVPVSGELELLPRIRPADTLGQSHRLEFRHPAAGVAHHQLAKAQRDL